MPKRLTLQDCKDTATARDGQCLSSEYKNSSTKLDWACKYGHSWSAKPQDIRAGYWCPYCAKTAKPSMNEIHLLAKSHGGKCLSQNYRNNREKLMWLCSKGHKFEMTLKAVKQLEQWCTLCSGKYRQFSNNHLVKIAATKGGSLLSSQDKFLISDSAKWRCSNGHEWTTKIANVFSNKSWCPECQSNRGERICRFIFEQSTGKEFPSKRPSWLRDELQRKSMELDGYCEELKIAFEHQGKQHYSQDAISFFGAGVIERDEKKRRICADYGVKVLEIPQIGHFLSVEDAIDLIFNFLKTNNVPIIKSVTPRDIDENPKKVFDERLLQVQRIARSKGGNCLSGVYLGHITPLAFKCSKNHQWLARPNDIKRGSWCSICSGAGGKRKTIEDLKNMYIDEQIECISESYSGSRTRYLWRCSKGHRFEARYDSLKNKVQKCPLCVRG